MHYVESCGKCTGSIRGTGTVYFPSSILSFGKKLVSLPVPGTILVRYYGTVIVYFLDAYTTVISFFFLNEYEEEIMLHTKKILHTYLVEP